MNNTTAYHLEDGGDSSFKMHRLDYVDYLINGIRDTIEVIEA